MRRINPLSIFTTVCLVCAPILLLGSCGPQPTYQVTYGDKVVCQQAQTVEVDENDVDFWCAGAFSDDYSLPRTSDIVLVNNATGVREVVPAIDTGFIPDDDDDGDAESFDH